MKHRFSGRSQRGHRGPRGVKRRGSSGRGLRLGQAAFLLAVALPVALRLAEVVSGYATPTMGCRITGVIDGDTVRLACPDSDAVRGRLVGFDTPEIFSPACAAEWRAGLAATIALRGAIWSARRIETVDLGEDRYGRRLVRVRLDGADVSERMIAAGHARAYDGGRRGSWCE